MNLLKKFVREEAGMETVEWAIMAGLILIGAVVAITAVGGNVQKAFENLQSNTNAAAK